jgi:CheY-like chemotaxis protein
LTSKALPDSVDLTGLAGVRGLIVDDNATSRRILNKMLRDWKMEPVEASTAAEGARVAPTRSQDSQPYPLLLADMNMLEQSGAELIERIRGGPQGKQPAVIMLVTNARRLGLGGSRAWT